MGRIANYSANPNSPSKVGKGVGVGGGSRDLVGFSKKTPLHKQQIVPTKSVRMDSLLIREGSLPRFKNMLGENNRGISIIVAEQN